MALSDEGQFRSPTLCTSRKFVLSNILVHWTNIPGLLAKHFLSKTLVLQTNITVIFTCDRIQYMQNSIMGGPVRVDIKLEWVTTRVRPRQAERRPGKAVRPDVRPKFNARSDVRPIARPRLGLARPNTCFAHTWFEDIRPW